MYLAMTLKFKSNYVYSCDQLWNSSFGNNNKQCRCNCTYLMWNPGLVTVLSEVNLSNTLSPLDFIEGCAVKYKPHWVVSIRLSVSSVSPVIYSQRITLVVRGFTRRSGVQGQIIAALLLIIHLIYGR